MKNDFPKNELKPLARIFYLLDNGQYVCYGIFDEDKLCGYAYFAVLNEDGKYYLLDYFATVDGMRGKGIGSEFLGMLYTQLSDAEMVICEAESPEGTAGEELELRNRRIDFYLRNRYIATGVNATAFGVDFVLLELDLGKKHSKDEVREYYLKLYRSFLPEKMFKEHIKVN
jgi:GNAT superfamily N-acetyltransferase